MDIANMTQSGITQYSIVSGPCGADLLASLLGKQVSMHFTVRRNSYKVYPDGSRRHTTDSSSKGLRVRIRSVSGMERHDFVGLGLKMRVMLDGVAAEIWVVYNPQVRNGHFRLSDNTARLFESRL